jgi:hypothetical protein
MLMNSPAEHPSHSYRQSLSQDLESRLLTVWGKLGHLIEWCDDARSWIELFHSEARLHRAAFYWEAIAEMFSVYLLEHPRSSAERVLTDCLIATQHTASDDDSTRVIELRDSWQEILNSSRDEIEKFIQADLDLALLEGTFEIVARRYAADYQRWEMDEEEDA